MAMGDVINIEDIPYFDKRRLDGGFISSLNFFDEQWRIWLQVQDGKQFIETRAWPAEGFYWAKDRENTDDLASIFMTFIAQCANYPEIMPIFAAIQDDVFNIASSLAKIDLIFKHGTDRDGSTRMACGEIEFLLTVCRSIFDLMQEFIAKIWARIVVIDIKSEKKKLRETFSDMIFKSNKRLMSEEIADRFNLPSVLSDCYARHSAVFEKIRFYRDNIVHRGYKMEIVFRGEQSFLIRKRFGPFRDLDVWQSEEIEENDLAPLLPVLHLIVHETLATCEDFASVFATKFKFPAPLVPGMHLFMRGHHDRFLVEALSDADERCAQGKSLVK